jgi:septal ring factor EnvC (AmiA/AmiB activator)
MENMMKLVLQEVQQMNQHISSVESTNKNILASQEQLTAHIQATEDGVRRVEETVAQTVNSKKSAPKTSNTSKNISNQHPKLKVRINVHSIT